MTEPTKPEIDLNKATVFVMSPSYWIGVLLIRIAIAFLGYSVYVMLGQDLSGGMTAQITRQLWALAVMYLIIGFSWAVSRETRAYYKAYGLSTITGDKIWWENYNNRYRSSGYVFTQIATLVAWPAYLVLDFIRIILWTIIVFWAVVKGLGTKK